MSIPARRVLVAIIAAGVAGTGLRAVTTAPQPSCFVTTTTGDVQGLDNGSSCSFLGIPFAAPPTNDFRWRPPQPAAPWTTTLNVITPPANCPNVQAGVMGNEDCLKLNVWVPDPMPSTPAPVIVWLHTGAFIAASANFAGHNGRRLAEETGAIVVAGNYRLGPLGFLVHPAFAAENPTETGGGNYGLLDQRATLVWVQNNIARFGGDPQNVTIAGTSAGGEGVGLHLVSPDSAPLFHRAVVQSGAPTARWPSVAEASAQGASLATQLGCTDPATVATCLRSLPLPQVMLALPLAQQQVRETPGRVYWLPVVDGVVIPDQPRALFERGRFARVPTIVGFNRDEGWGNFITRSFPNGVSAADYESWVGTEFGPHAADVLSLYPTASFAMPVDAMAQVVGDGQFVCEGQRLAGLISESHVPTYLYSYEHVIDDLAVGRVIHGVEGNILFNNPYQPMQFPNHPLNATDVALHHAMAGYWTRFARTGSPNVDDETIVHWPLHKSPLGEGRGALKYLTLQPAIEPGKRLREDACGMWHSLNLRTLLGPVPGAAQ